MDANDLINDNDEIDNHKNNSSLPVNIISSSFNTSSLMKPNQAGFLEYFLLNTSSYEGAKTFSIKIRAIDASSNCGKWTWPLTIKLGDQIELSPQLKHFVLSENSKFLTDEKKLSQGGNEKHLSKFFIGFISKFFTFKNKEKIINLIFDLSWSHLHFICTYCIINCIVCLQVKRVED